MNVEQLFDVYKTFVAFALGQDVYQLVVPESRMF